jgi:hypothetical protein
VARGGVLTGGRVDSYSGQLLELRGMTGEVRAAPNREKVADWRASPWGAGDGNGRGQKHGEDRGGSVATTDERR